EPGPLSVFVGPNAAGKSNLADAIDFLGDVYGWGLEPAVARKGGYENICFRHLRRTGAAIRFRVVVTQEHAELSWSDPADELVSNHYEVTLDHSFSFKAKTQAVQAPFSIVTEEIAVSIRAEGGRPQEILRITRRGGELKRKELPFKGTSLVLLGPDLQ